MSPRGRRGRAPHAACVTSIQRTPASTRATERLRVDLDAAHPLRLHEDGVGHRAERAGVVAGALRCHAVAVRPRVLDDRDDVVRRLGQHDEGGPLVDGKVPGSAGLVPVRIARRHHVARDPGAKSLDVHVPSFRCAASAPALDWLQLQGATECLGCASRADPRPTPKVFSASRGREVLVVGGAPAAAPCPAAGRERLDDDASGRRHAGTSAVTVEEAPSRGRQHARAEDVWVLHRVDVDREPVGVARPASRWPSRRRGGS